jgi:hypothetical protein
LREGLDKRLALSRSDLPVGLFPHGEEAQSAVSNHEARGPSFETPLRGSSG